MRTRDVSVAMWATNYHDGRKGSETQLLQPKCSSEGGIECDYMPPEGDAGVKPTATGTPAASSRQRWASQTGVTDWRQGKRQDCED